MDKNLQNIANKLKHTRLFIGNSDLDKMLNKQMIFLVAAGQKPLTRIYSSHWEDTSTGSISCPDDPTEVALFIKSIGLECELEDPEEHFTMLSVAKDRQLLERAVANPEKQGAFYGYPRTAQEAFIDGKSLPMDVQEETMKKAGIPMGFSVFALSKDHHQDEVKVLKNWYELLCQYGLDSES